MILRSEKPGLVKGRCGEWISAARLREMQPKKLMMAAESFKNTIPYLEALVYALRHAHKCSVRGNAQQAQVYMVYAVVHLVRFTKDFTRAVKLLVGTSNE